MKLKFIYSIFFLLICASCSTDNNLDQGPTEVRIFQWHLTNVSGGIAGVDIDFDPDTVIWVFNVDINGNGSLSVQNDNNDDSLEDSFDSGVYSVTIPVYDETNSILFVDGEEYGAVVTPNENGENLIIDQTITSTGTLSDGFKYSFKRKIITETIN